MSMIETGIEIGFVEMCDGCMVVYPKRILNPIMLKQVISEAVDNGYIVPNEMTFNKPIVMKKKQDIDMTEVFVKLFALSARYGVNLTIHTFANADTIEVHFVYKHASITKTFDVEMLCAMEKDFILGWFEEQLQKIDAELKQEKKDE